MAGKGGTLSFQRSKNVTVIFKFSERDGYFYGRGTAEIKGEAASLIANPIRVKQERLVSDRDFIVALTAD